jgi:hypothetical protein
MRKLLIAAFLLILGITACGEPEAAPASTPVGDLIVITPVGAEEGSCAPGEDGTSACDATVQPVAENVLVAPPVDLVLPEFALPAASGETVRLSDYLGEQPFAVVFYRGFF